MLRSLIAKFFVICFLSMQAFAGQTISLPKLSDDQGGLFLREIIEIGQENHNYEFSFARADEEEDEPFKNGDFVVLWGIGESEVNQNMTHQEYNSFWRLMNYLTEKQFKVILHTQATEQELRAVVESGSTSVILFSSHGNQTGFYDFNSQRIPYDIFANKSPTLYQFILSACYGTQALTNYNVPSDLKTYSWNTTIDSSVTIDFMAGNNWSPFTKND